MPSRWLIGRVIVKSSLLLLLAVIVNIAVAWGCVCWSPVQRAEEAVVGDWPAPAPSHWTGEVWSWPQSGFGLTADGGEISGGTKKQQWALIAGWPFRCLFYEQHRTALNASWASVAPFAPPTSWREGLTIPQWIPWCSRERPGWANLNAIPEVCYLPVRPLWNGFVGNLLFYTVLLWSLSLAAGALSRLWRRHRRLCELCGYPRGTSPVCTECGAHLRTRESTLDRLLHRARSSTALRTRARQTIICLLLAAILQYLVAAAFGLRGSCRSPDQHWGIGLSGNELGGVLRLHQNSSIGRTVLSGEFLSDRTGVVQRTLIPSPPVWARGAWINIGGAATSTSPGPPAWSRFAQLRAAATFDDDIPTGWEMCIEVGCGWPMRSASYFAAATTAPGPFLVLDGLVIANTATADTPSDNNSTPRALPWRLYWPGMIVNTLVYATILLTPFTLLPGILAYLRRRAGRCPACSCDLRGANHTICPECDCDAADRA